MLWLLHYYASSEAAWQVQHDVAQQSQRFERAVAIGADLERTRFDQFVEPAVRFPLAAAYRGLGRAREADRFYNCKVETTAATLGQLRQAEIHVADPKSRPMKPVLECVRAKERPHLDGQLDDPVWRQAKPAVLQSAQHDDGDWPAEVLLAYDDEFLYLAIRCREAPGAHGTEENGKESPS